MLAYAFAAGIYIATFPLVQLLKDPTSLIGSNQILGNNHVFMLITDVVYIL